MHHELPWTSFSESRKIEKIKKKKIMNYRKFTCKFCKFKFTEIKGVKINKWNEWERKKIAASSKSSFLRISQNKIEKKIANYGKGTGKIFWV